MRVLGFLVLIVFGLAATGAAAERKPNVLFLLSDDQRPDTIAALGNPLIRTPHLDALVKRGTAFTRATCAHPLCYPSRAEILTGCTGFRNGAYSGLKLIPNVPLLPETLRAAGYRTCYVGKWHTSGRPSGIGYESCEGLYGSGKVSDQPYLDFRGRPATGYRGWQFQTDGGERFPEKGIGLTPEISAEFATAAIRAIQNTDDRPWFLHVNFTAPHDPRLIPPGAQWQYPSASLPLPRNFRMQHPFDHGNIAGRDEVLLPTPRTPEDVREELAAYYAVISHMDAQIGRILAAIDAAGERDNTLVVFASDHGLALGSHGLVGKQNMYEHTINVPLIVAGPGIPEGRKSAAQCYLRDLFPTICELAGIAAPESDGRSLIPVLRGMTEEVHPFIVGYFQDSQRMIREDHWKLIVYPKVSRRQLFNLASDSDELHDLSGAPEHSRRIAELESRLSGWLTRHGDPQARAMIKPSP